MKRFPNVMVNAIMGGLGNYRAAAIALEMMEADAQGTEQVLKSKTRNDP